MRGTNPARNSPRKKHSAFQIIGTMQHCRGLPSYLWYSLGANLAKERSGFSDKCAGCFSDGSFYCLVLSGRPWLQLGCGDGHVKCREIEREEWMFPITCHTPAPGSPTRFLQQHRKGRKSLGE